MFFNVNFFKKNFNRKKKKRVKSKKEKKSLIVFNETVSVLCLCKKWISISKEGRRSVIQSLNSLSIIHGVLQCNSNALSLSLSSRRTPSVASQMNKPFAVHFTFLPSSA